MIKKFAEALATEWGYMATLGTIVLGAAIGALFGWSAGWLLGFNLYLSIAAIIIGGAILVAGRESECALQAKLDELIRVEPAADNHLIGVERDQ